MTYEEFQNAIKGDLNGIVEKVDYLKEFEENFSMWINIEDLLKENKKFPSVEIIKHLEGNNINLKIYSDDDHNILNIEH